MKCTSCGNNLVAVTESGIQIDVCSNGCGGIWFDAGELEKLDEEHEAISNSSLFSGKNQNTVVVDRARIKKCPKCITEDLERKCNYFDYDIEIDSCKKCSGVWLDSGELRQLRGHNHSRQEREKAIKDFSQQADKTSSPSKIKAVINLLFK